MGEALFLQATAHRCGQLRLSSPANTRIVAAFNSPPLQQLPQSASLASRKANTIFQMYSPVAHWDGVSASTSITNVIATPQRATSGGPPSHLKSTAARASMASG